MKIQKNSGNVIESQLCPLCKDVITDTELISSEQGVNVYYCQRHQAYFSVEQSSYEGGMPISQPKNVTGRGIGTVQPTLGRN